jgi:hypothetical protein
MVVRAKDDVGFCKIIFGSGLPWKDFARLIAEKIRAGKVFH